MADVQYEQKSIEEIEQMILKVRMYDLKLEKELCYTLTEKAKLENDSYALAFSYTFLGDYYLAMRNNDSCILYLNRAKTLGETMNYQDLLVRIYNYLGMFYCSINDEFSAMDDYLKSLTMAEEQQNIAFMAAAYNNIADCFEGKKDFEKALHYYKKSYAVLKGSDKNGYSKAVALTNLCHCCHRSHRIDDLHNYLKAFDEIDQQYYTPGMQFMRLYSEAVGALSDHQLDKFYQKSDALFEMEKEMEDLLLVYQLFINICMDFLVLKNKDYAARCLEILLEVNEDEDVKALREIHKLMIKYCKIFDLHDELIEAYERFYHITMAIEDMEQATYSAGLYTKIELHRAKEKQNDLKKENEQLEYMMNIDDLTSTANRRSFNHMLKNERVQKAKSLAFAMLDIDYFKEYNDRYGHQMGDQALIEFGKTLIRYAQEDILPFRYGGDEFVVIFINVNEDTVLDFLNHVKTDFRGKQIAHHASPIEDILSVSYGHAYQATPQKDVEALLKEADYQLYKVKKARKKAS